MKKALIALAALLLCTGGAKRAWCADLTGQVLDTRSCPVSNVKLMLYTLDGKPMGEAVPGSGGRYTIEGLSPGKYKLVLDPLASGFQGGDALSSVGPAGLTVSWNVSSTAPALAEAKEGTEISQKSGAGGFDQLRCGAYAAAAGAPGGVIGATGVAAAVVAGGVVGGIAAAGGFSGGPASPAQ